MNQGTSKAKRTYGKFVCLDCSKTLRKTSPSQIRCRVCSGKHDKERHRRYVEDLADSYIKSLIAKGSFLTSADIPPAMVEFKRAHLMLKRAIKEKLGV